MNKDEYWVRTVPGLVTRVNQKEFVRLWVNHVLVRCLPKGTPYDWEVQADAGIEVDRNDWDGDVLGQRIRAVKARVYRNVACVCAEHVRALCAVPHGVGDPDTHEIHAFNVLDRTGQVEHVGVS